MAYRGHVENGVVVLDGPAQLPEGAAVLVELADEATGPTLAEKLAPFIGCLDGLPSDLAEDHDHYLYGVPKRKEPSATQAERLADVIGTIEGPPDLARNHDHYAHGKPKPKR